MVLMWCRDLYSIFVVAKVLRHPLWLTGEYKCGRSRAHKIDNVEGVSEAHELLAGHFNVM